VLFAPSECLIQEYTFPLDEPPGGEKQNACQGGLFYTLLILQRFYNVIYRGYGNILHFFNILSNAEYSFTFVINNTKNKIKAAYFLLLYISVSISK
jgi:hypothetical protein